MSSLLPEVVEFGDDDELLLFPALGDEDEALFDCAGGSPIRSRSGRQKQAVTNVITTATMIRFVRFFCIVRLLLIWIRGLDKIDARVSIIMRQKEVSWGKPNVYFSPQVRNCGTYHKLINKIDENALKWRVATVLRGVCNSPLRPLPQPKTGSATIYSPLATIKKRVLKTVAVCRRGSITTNTHRRPTFPFKNAIAHP